MEDSNFASLNREIADDISGTEVQPLLVNVLTKTRGATAEVLQKEKRSSKQIQDGQNCRSAKSFPAPKVCGARVHSRQIFSADWLDAR